MEKDTGAKLSQLRVDGGPTRNRYLMQLQSDLLEADVLIPGSEELSGIGAAYMAGLSCGVLTDDVFSTTDRATYHCTMGADTIRKKYIGWKQAIGKVLTR